MTPADHSTHCRDVPEILGVPKLPSLDGFRGISILIVITGHVFHGKDAPLLRIFSGNFGVQIFFVISGFLITTLLMRERATTGAISLRKFYARRFLRIFPVAYVYLITLLVIDALFDTKIPIVGFISSALYLRNTSFLGAGDWHTGHFWSLSVEEQFYFLFPFLLKRTLVGYVLALAVLIVTIPVLHYAVFHRLLTGNIAAGVDSVLRNMSAIFVGSLASLAFFRGAISERALPRSGTTFLSLGLFSGAALVQSNLLPLVPSALANTLASVLIATLIVINLKKPRTTSLVFTALNSKILTHIGVLSYSLYIWQQVMTYSPTVPWRGASVWTDSLLFNLVLLLVVSHVSYYGLERQFLKLKDRYRAVSG